MSHIQNYNHSEHLAIDEVAVLFKGKAAFQQDIQKKHKHFRIKIYTLCDTYGYTRHRSVLTERQKTGHKRHDSDQCYIETTDKKGKEA
jgi:hypothetical protein